MLEIYITVKEIININEFKKGLEKLLCVPEVKIRTKVIEEITNYFMKKQEWIKEGKFKIFMAYAGDEICGMVVGQNDPNYSSYGRKCGSFGWLLIDNDLGEDGLEICKLLMENVNKYLLTRKIRRVRGPINYPKTLGGVGIQVSGFEYGMMYGEAWGDPNSRVIEFLDILSYERESKYANLYVPNKLWKSGKQVDKSIRLGYLPLEEVFLRRDEFLELVKKSFQGNFPMPDMSSSTERMLDIFNSYKELPESFWKMKDLGKIESLEFDPSEIDVPEYKEIWDADLEKLVSILPLAFERETGKIIGAVLVVPDLFQHWAGEKVHRFNADTSIIHLDYKGKGIYSALSNLGRLTGQMCAEQNMYVEGGQVWYNNPDALKAIFPHCEVIKEHYVMQKRIKRS